MPTTSSSPQVSSPHFFERTLTELDHLRVGKLIDRLDPQAPVPAAMALQALLDEAEQVEARRVPPDVVTMQSQVLVAAPDGERSTLTLCYPPQADAARGFVSVLSPIGAALLGARAGATVNWRLPDGGAGTLVVLAVAFQPEASGDYTA